MCLKKNNILFIFTIIFFFIVFLITNKKNTPPYDFVSESLIIGRLLESERSSLFSYSGLTGVIAQSDEDYYKNALLQFELLENKDLNNLFFFTYNSQPGFQAFLYASFNKISPFNIKTNINILQKITMLLNSIIFLYF